MSLIRQSKPLQCMAFVQISSPSTRKAIPAASALGHSQLKLAMAASLLNAVEPIIKGKSFEDLCKATFPVSGLISIETADDALQSAQELLSNDGEYTLHALSTMCGFLPRLLLPRSAAAPF